MNVLKIQPCFMRIFSHSILYC